MRGKKWGFGIFCICLLVIGLFVKHLNDIGRIHFAWWLEKVESIELTNGTYDIDELGLLPGTYAVYAVDGFGDVLINDYTYDLDILDFEDGLSRMPSFMDTIVYYNIGPKVTVDSHAVIIVDGEEDFTISFVRAIR